MGFYRTRVNCEGENRQQSVSLGDVFWAELEKIDDCGKTRPVIVLQNNMGNACSPNVVVIPITSVIKKLYLPTHVFIPKEELGIKRDGVALCENPTCIEKVHLLEKVGHLSDKYIEKVAIANTLASSAISYLTPNQLLTVWRKSGELNANRV